MAVSPLAEADHWVIDVACRDTDGLLARLTDVLADSQLQVVRADIATWADGGVVDSFVVRSYERPSARELGAAFEEGLKRPLAAVDPVDVQFAVLQDALPWYTVCTVSGPDAPGVLRAVARSFAAAEVIVHSARLSTQDGQMSDRFTVSDRFGRKLDERTVERIRQSLLDGTGRRRRR